MTHLWPDGPSIDQIKQDITDKWVTQRWHPRLPLQVLNYSQKCQHKNHWTTETTACRGLILNDEWDVIERPFGKFFWLGRDEAPDEPFVAQEKADGSLGILYWEDTLPSIATRGSFTSWQALAATIWVRKTGLGMRHINAMWTYLFEIIHPQNRIVVDYGSQEKLILLAIIDKATGLDISLSEADHLPFEKIASYPDRTDLNALEIEDRDNKEGYVVVWKSGFRAKIKHESYTFTHRLVTQMTPRAIWELLKAGLNPLDMLEDYAPGDFRIWIKDQIEALWDAYEGIQDRCYADMLLRPDTDDRKATALYFQTCKHPSVLFAMLDEKPYSEIIWKMIRPAAGEPFRVEV
jgi:hypothetical protein